MVWNQSLMAVDTSSAAYCLPCAKVTWNNMFIDIHKYLIYEESGMTRSFTLSVLCAQVTPVATEKFKSNL